MISAGTSDAPVAAEAALTVGGPRRRGRAHRRRRGRRPAPAARGTRPLRRRGLPGRGRRHGGRAAQRRRRPGRRTAGGGADERRVRRLLRWARRPAGDAELLRARASRWSTSTTATAPASSRPGWPATPTGTTVAERPSERLAWVDASSGASGDMLLGALVGAGVPVGVLVEAVDKVAPGQVGLEVAEVRRGGFAATRCQVEVADTAEHRTWRDVERAAQRGRAARGRALARARRVLAAGRGRGPGARPRRPRTCTSTRSAPWTRSPTWSASAPGSSTWALDRVVVSDVSVGGGTVSSEHGRLPVPPPAVVELLRGVPTLRRSGRRRAVHADRAPPC